MTVADTSGLVLVPGGGVTNGCWNRVARLLRPPPDLVVAALPIADDRLASEWLDAAADQLIVDIDAVGLTRARLVAFSLGCAVAIRTTIRHPHRVSALMLVGGFARADNDTLAVLDAWRSVAEGNSGELADHVLRMICSDHYVDALTEEYRTVLRAVFDKGIETEPSQHLEVYRDVDVRADLPHIAVPTLVVQLRRDRVATPVVGAALARGIPGARLVWLDSGHMVGIEQPSALAHLIEQFRQGDAAMVRRR